MPYLSCEKNENKQKEAGFGPFFKTRDIALAVYDFGLIFLFAEKQPVRSTSPHLTD